MKVQVCVMSDNDVIYIDTAVEIDLEVFPRKGEIVILSKIGRASCRERV